MIFNGFERIHKVNKPKKKLSAFAAVVLQSWVPLLVAAAVAAVVFVVVSAATGEFD